MHFEFKLRNPFGIYRFLSYLKLHFDVFGGFWKFCDLVWMFQLLCLVEMNVSSWGAGILLFFVGKKTHFSKKNNIFEAVDCIFVQHALLI
ncbi:hypothetical protein AAHA92_18482 [Salvia divinorum]|uniref:Uncharacterized protein n=1 Tax=Salvia divinorum TaxID=28513 RepID=A0ABD1H510_SALDI